MTQEEKRKKKVLAQDAAYLAKMLNGKKLPPAVTNSYERARMLADNAGMTGPLPVSLLVALVEKTDAEPASKKGEGK